MPMLSANLKILSELKDFITTISNNKLLLQKFSRCEKDFSRNRKLPFTRLAILISKLCKKTLSVELERFFEDISLPGSCSVSAFSQQRLKLDPFFSICGTMCSQMLFITITAVRQNFGKATE
jgi:hypothetical protein